VVASRALVLRSFGGCLKRIDACAVARKEEWLRRLALEWFDVAAAQLAQSMPVLPATIP
jgi:hypothetical protein